MQLTQVLHRELLLDGGDDAPQEVGEEFVRTVSSTYRRYASSERSHPRKEMRKVGEGVRLTAKGKSPQVVREAIQNDEIVSHTGDVGNEGCPEVTVDEVEGASSAG